LEVRIQKIQLAIPYALNAFSPGRGFLPDDYPYAKTKVIPLDEKRMVAHFADGIEIPVRPFFGSMGIAHQMSPGASVVIRHGFNAGNLDNKDLVAGTTLLSLFTRAGRCSRLATAMAGQGDGEVDVTALETSLIGTFSVYRT